FLYKLAFAMASAVPAGKFSGKALPATGPYMTASFRPNRSWVLVRNPRFHEWSNDAQPAGFPDRIVLKAAPRNQVAALEHGGADAADRPLRRLGARPTWLQRLTEGDHERRGGAGGTQRLEQAAADRLVQLAPGLPDAVELHRAAADLPFLRPPQPGQPQRCRV